MGKWWGGGDVGSGGWGVRLLVGGVAAALPYFVVFQILCFSETELLQFSEF